MTNMHKSPGNLVPSPCLAMGELPPSLQPGPHIPSSTGPGSLTRCEHGGVGLLPMSHRLQDRGFSLASNI